MKQKTGKLTVITVLLLTVCIAAGAMGLPRLLGESISIPEAAEPALSGTALWVGMDELPLEISRVESLEDALDDTEPQKLSAREREKAEKEALRQLLIFARENRIETLYWQVADEGDYSRLELLCKAADGSPAIWAAVKGDYAPTKKLKYEPAGLALWGDGLTAEELRNKLSGLGESGLPLALRWDAELAGEELTELVQKNNLTRLLPVLPEVAGREYIARSESWQNTGAEVTPVVTALQGGVTGSQLFYNARNGKAAGFVLANYGEISDNTAARGLLLSYADAAQTRPLTAVSLEYAKELHIGYPANNALVYTAQVFIMGTSDPTKPLTMDGKEVERTGEGGCFGVSVSLAYGKNYFTFRNGEDSLTLTIRRGSGTGDGTTSTLTSRFPTSDAAVWAGQELTFRCVAPSGSKVTAVIHGQTVTMQQTAATAKNGIAATYKGTYQVPADLPEGELQDWGPVKYTMVWGGKTTSYESAGRLYAAGKNTTPAVLANTENVSLLTDYTDDSTFIATYHCGAKIPMVGCFQYNGTIFYEVAGGYISSDRATVAPTPAAAAAIGAVSSVTEGRLTTITLPCGSYPAASAKREGALLTIYLENTALPESTEGIAAPMIKEARWEETEGGVNLLLTLNEESYWGYDLQYTEEGDLLLSLKEPPKLSATPGKPLEGITVMVDPGHGNKDCGAYGAAGLYGPAEAELNLAVSLAVRDRLEQMGATVIMTRETDDRETPKIVLDERVRMAVDAKPDFFLSIHHNSTGLTKYVSADWTVSYYCEDDSETYAANLAAAVTGATDRDTKGEEWGYYYVTRLGFCPAVLFEVGFIPNPEQYEACADWETICETASGLAEGLLRSVPR